MLRLADALGLSPASRRRNFSFSKANQLLLRPEEEAQFWDGKGIA
jgi:hypothetical protein